MRKNCDFHFLKTNDYLVVVSTRCYAIPQPMLFEIPILIQFQTITVYSLLFTVKNLFIKLQHMYKHDKSNKNSFGGIREIVG